MICFIDLDDTLVCCHKEYLDAIDRGAAFISTRLGIDAAIAKDMIQQLDILALRHNISFAKTRFPQSFTAAMKAAGELVNKRVSKSDLHEVYAIGHSVFEGEYTPFPGALEALRQMRTDGHKLAMLTQGDYSVQWYKIEKHGLNDLFDHIEITGHKTVDSMRDLWSRLGAPDPDTVVMIGDSLKHDIAPAKELGFRTIHIDHGSNNWVFSHQEGIRPDHSVQTFAEVPAYVQEEICGRS